MEKSEIRAVVKYCGLDNLSASEIHTKLVKVSRDSAFLFPTLHRWTPEFKRGRTNVNDDPRSERPKTATNQEMIDAVHDMVVADRRLR